MRNGYNPGVMAQVERLRDEEDLRHASVQEVVAG
jgi:hypothetical protein